MLKVITKEMIFQGTSLEFKESAPNEIQVLKQGEWDHPFYGKIVIDKRVLNEFKANFDRGLRKGIPINAGHDFGKETEAIGWMKKVTIKKGGLWATVEWTPKGKELLGDKSFKFFSPEFYRIYEDPETQEVYANVLVGGALTNKPYFKGLKAIVTSEPNNKLNFSETNHMNLKQILAKEAGTLTDEEKKHLQTHLSELTATDLRKFADDIAQDQESGDNNDNDGDNAGDNAGDNKDDDEVDDNAGDNNDGDKSGDDDDTGDDNGDNGGGDGNNSDGNGDGGNAGQSNADETIVMTKAEKKALETKANQGQEAYMEMQEGKINAEVEKMTFSDNNEKGKFLPKQKDSVTKFMMSLNEKQHKIFTEIVGEMPEINIFGEAGDAGATETTIQKEVDNKVNAKMKADDGMTYSDALKAVFDESPALAKKYEDMQETA